MNTRCPFDQLHLSFSGSPLDQARCLLRFVKRGGNVDDAPATLPPILEQLLGAPQTLNLTVAQLRAYLQLHNIPENTAGGSLDAPVSRADTNNPTARLAQYFMIHDTSFKLSAGQTFDSNFINTAQWSGNRLANLSGGKTHIYITRLGQTKMDNDYGTPFRATQFELQPKQTLSGAPKATIFRGYFLHHELVQPRMGPKTSDIDSPDPGFTQAQYERLALQYLIASVRRGSWMIPAFHCVLDLRVGDHDDPQHFDLSVWGEAIVKMLAAVRSGGGGQPQPPPPTLKSRLLAGDPILQDVAAGNRVLDFNQVRSLTGVGPLQDALNLLADNGQPSLNISGARGPNGFRGFYGKQTIAAVSAFQALKQIAPVDGKTGRDTILALDAAVLTAEGGGVPAVDTPVLKSDLLQGDNTLEAVADGHIVLHATEGMVDGIGPVQDALNRLGFPINLGNRNQFRGFFGEKTRAAVEAFQASANIDVNGRVGSDTIRKLDENLMASAAGGERPAAGAPVPAGKFAKTLKQVFNRGRPKPAFLQELVAWAKTAPEEIFTDQPGNKKDVYASVTTELGSFEDITHRKACMLEIMRVLAGFESSWDFNEGIDTSRESEDTPKNSEAGAWQVSADSLAIGKDLKDLVQREVGTLNGIEFQKAMKSNHPLAMEYIARLMRHTRMANGPLYKGSERNKLSPKVRAQEQSIYPWLSRDAVAEFQAFLA